MNVLAELLACVHAEYSRDATRAGVVLSKLDYGGTHYASICRYPGGPADKQVICKAEGTTLDEALRAV